MADPVIAVNPPPATIAPAMPVNPATPPIVVSGKSAETQKKMAEIEKQFGGQTSNIPYLHEYWGLRNHYLAQLAEERMEAEVKAVAEVASMTKK